MFRNSRVKERIFTDVFPAHGKVKSTSQYLVDVVDGRCRDMFPHGPIIREDTVCPVDIHGSSFYLKVVNIIQKQLFLLPVPAGNDEFPGAAFCPADGTFQHVCQLLFVHRL